MVKLRLNFLRLPH